MSALSHEFEYKLPVPPTRAFTALTDASDLKAWFAENVDIEPKAGGRFHFWGKYTYGAPPKSQATQQIVRYEKPKLLAFTWTLQDQPSTVSISLEADPGAANGSVVKVRHEFAQAPRIDRAKELVDDLWRLNIGNLATYLGGGQALLADYTDTKPEIHASILINAPREHVFRALMEPSLLNKWIAKAAEVDARVNGSYSYGWGGGGPTRIIDMVRNEKLVTDWPDWRGDKNVPVQTITWVLETVGKQTRVTLIHSGFVRTVDYSDYPHGWSYFLDRLRMVSEGDASLQPFTASC